MLTEWNVTLKVDDCGFFIYWKGKDTEGDVLELSQVNDIRPGKYPNVRRLFSFFFLVYIAIVLFAKSCQYVELIL